MNDEKMAGKQKELTERRKAAFWAYKEADKKFWIANETKEKVFQATEQALAELDKARCEYDTICAEEVDFWFKNKKE